MASPQPDIRPGQLEQLTTRGGLGALVAVLLTTGFDSGVGWDTGRLNRYLRSLDDRQVLNYSSEILKVAADDDEMELNEANMALIDVAHDTYATRDAQALIDWVTTHIPVDAGGGA